MCLGHHDNTEGLMVRIFKEIAWEMVWLTETREHGVSGTSDGTVGL